MIESAFMRVSKRHYVVLLSCGVAALLLINRDVRFHIGWWWVSPRHNTNDVAAFLGPPDSTGITFFEGPQSGTLHKVYQTYTWRRSAIAYEILFDTLPSSTNVLFVSRKRWHPIAFERY